MHIITPEEVSREAAEAQARGNTVQDYDDALEEYCKEVRVDRGYTTCNPVDYANSTVARWKQDALDYSKFRDDVLLYGLEVENQYAETGVPPCTLDEFKTHLRTIKCNWTYELS